MKRAHEKAPQFIADMRKRFAKEFADNFISKEEFDEVEEGLSTVEKMTKTLNRRHYVKDNKRAKDESSL